MEFVKPRVMMLADTGINYGEVLAYLDGIGASGWDTDAFGDGEQLIEIAGKTCYKSFNVVLNPNLTKVTEGDNTKYIGRSILSNKHWSVLEHVNVTFAFVDVSRVFTHEMVRHRIASYSQESLRFVRLTELKGYFPAAFQIPFLEHVVDHLGHNADDTAEELEDELHNIFRTVFEYLEDTQKEIAKLLQLDKLDSFQDKKKLTSAMRRLAPIGLATTLIATANLRTWRGIIEKRTAAGAEEEIRLVFNQVFEHLRTKFPACFQDARRDVVVDGLDIITFANGTG